MTADEASWRGSKRLGIWSATPPRPFIGRIWLFAFDEINSYSAGRKLFFIFDIIFDR